ncbi:MAG: ATPase [Pseudomonadota bacterium]
MSKKKRSILVTKLSGQKEYFSEHKLIRSLESSGVPAKDAREIIGKIYDQLYPGISTEELYRIAFSNLKRRRSPLAARYSLKKAIAQLGPTGFPFERVVGAVLAKQGFRVQFDVMMAGAHISHEIDVFAVRQRRRIFAECKYHNRLDNKCDVKVALYVQARALDIREGTPGTRDEFHLFTNTRFTTDAIRYGEGVGLRLTGWDYPEGAGLKRLIEKSRSHPVTCLTTLSAWDKKWLLERRLVLCGELRENIGVLRQLGWRDRDLSNVRREIDELASMEMED